MSARSRNTIRILLAVLFLFLGTEVILRFSGFGSFPVFDVSDDLKYIPSANQSGAFMNLKRWAFNDRHMGNTVNWTPYKHPNILLIGNSIVMGGNPYDQDEKLTASLEKALHGSFSVWSIAAGGWTNVNEMTYIDKNIDVVKNCDVVVVEYMEGGLSRASPWPGEGVDPAHKPLLLTTYWFAKYFLPRLLGMASADDFGPLPPVDNPDAVELERFNRFVSSTSLTSRVVIFLYPDKRNLADAERWQKATAPVVALCKTLAITCVDLATENSWRPNLYVGETHPSVAGIKVLANILAKHILALNANSEL
jgi:hypothetical protein